MSVDECFDLKSKRTEIALSLIRNLDQSLEKIHHDVAQATLEYDSAFRNAEFAKRIHQIYSSSSSSYSLPLKSPSKSYRLELEPLSYSSVSPLHRISPLSRSSPIEKETNYLLELEHERELHEHTIDQLEKSLQKEEELQQIIELMQSKLRELQVRILAAEKDAEIALDLAKSNEIYIKQLEISRETCQLEKSNWAAEMKIRLLSESCVDPSLQSMCLSSPSRQNTTTNRAMITRGREILQKRRLARGAINSNLARGAINSDIKYHL